MSGILSAFVGGTYSSAPVNTVAPAVTGTAQARQTLSCSTGTWTGVPTPTYTYQWQYGVSNTPISGATSSTYVVSSTYVGQTIRCVVTATNSVGAVSANSNSTSAVTANVPTAPTIGTATATGSTTATVTYTAPSDNGGATITTYTATSSPGGITGTLSTSGSGTITVSGLTTNTAYTFTVTATNSVGTSAASSASNSVTPVASGFLATMTFTGYSYAFAANVATNSSGTIYVYGYGGGGTGQNSILQFSTTGTNNWKRYGYTQGPFFSNGVDASNNYYVLGTYNSNNRVQVTKYNSSDVFQWSTWWDETGTTYLAAMTKPFFDSSGNMYFGIERVVDYGCCGTANNYVMRKVTSAGAVVTAANIYLNVGSTGYSNPAGVGVDSSGNIYNVAVGFDSGYSTIVIVKSTSAYAFVSGKAYLKASPSAQSYEAYGYAFDATNTVGYIAGRGANGAIIKHDSALAISWAYQTTGIFVLRDCALDSSGNIYAVGYYQSGSTYAMRMIKLNSSGTLQWARTITTSLNLDTSYMHITVSGSKYTVGGAVYTGSGTIGFILEVPTDGSGTGTFSNGGYTWTYASYSESLTSVTLTNQGTASQTTSAPSTSGSVTPTVATATAWNTSSTQF